jgi:hypothetical protein
MLKNYDLEKEKIRINLSFGMIAIYLGGLKIVIDFIDKSGVLKYFGYFFYGTLTSTILLLVLYVISTAAKYKSIESNFIDDYFYITEKTRNFFYDFAINGLAIGFFNILLMFLISAISKYSNHGWIGWVVGPLIIFIVIHLLGRKTDKIKKNNLYND